jgi:glyoxylase-like metal-dependent hydrolase (beta-lactamase superfamily II)
VAALNVRFCDDFDDGFGWIVDGEFMERCSHALIAHGRVWVIDPVDGDGVEERIRAAGEPAGVIQLLDRHKRDSRLLADLLGVPRYDVPVELIAGAPFDFLVVRKGWTWREVALWWPERRVLVCADALGTAAYFVAPDERLAVHPFLRLVPPRRRLGNVQPEVVLCGHGEGILSDAAPLFQEALSTARRRIPSALANAPRAWRRSRAGR